MVLNLGCIVEGQGDVSAVPALIRRIHCELMPRIGLEVWKPRRVGRYTLVQPGQLEKWVETLARQLPAPRGILILIDADTDCPAELGPTLLHRAKTARPDIPVGVVLAKHEYEAWFLASIESLRGHRGISDDAEMPASPEDIRGAKERLSRLMGGGGAYSSTRDQPALTAQFDMQLARKRSDSFDKCWREVERLFAEAAGEPPPEPRQPV